MYVYVYIHMYYTYALFMRGVDTLDSSRTRYTAITTIVNRVEKKQSKNRRMQVNTRESVYSLYLGGTTRVTWTKEKSRTFPWNGMESKF